jgi:hypothetical protein
MLAGALVRGVVIEIAGAKQIAGTGFDVLDLHLVRDIGRHG